MHHISFHWSLFDDLNPFDRLQRWPTAASLLRRLERASNICAISGGKLERSKSTTFTPAVHRDDTFRVSLACELCCSHHVVF